MGIHILCDEQRLFRAKTLTVSVASIRVWAIFAITNFEGDEACHPTTRATLTKAIKKLARANGGKVTRWVRISGPAIKANPMQAGRQSKINASNAISALAIMG